MTGFAGPAITVVGIGADGWAGLGEPARAAIHAADELVGSERQLATLPEQPGQRRRAWPSPLEPLLDEVAGAGSGSIVVLASGDPLLYGIGGTLLRRLGPDAVTDGRLRFLPAPSALTLACGRLGWPVEEVQLLSTVGRPPAALARWCQPGRRLIVYVSGVDGAARVAELLTDMGFGASPFSVLERLGAEDEQITTTTAAGWGSRHHDRLSTAAVHLSRPTDAPVWPTTPGLPDAAYDHDGALTKRHIRAVTLAALAPIPGERLWDIGAGSGSIAIEWLRAEPTAEAVAIEPRADRAARITANAARLGVPRLEVVCAAAPAALGHLDGAPEAIFIGGGLATGLLGAAWDRLAPCGRIVANAVTIEGEHTLIDAQRRYGGELVRLSVAHAEPLGRYHAWRPALEIVQWAAQKATNGPERER
ncbi:precorrin-6y C5,15-methyltransferase (decarboxylating) subunit CbiE [Conexibacter sp. DBS9H8]|uniref:precorrin-6y C5,15-methyltransferase (decarboxylating) subunit CbiE n=1 Tax=Conexibacter sp. DBS9H8 TaxID=2937801 RepID=UPI00200CB04D|nr:precorrin-6y C5,15-methyltransferase (decarboxylating) subunit CbiE [Conexibacter sp. DBS9H8]